MPELTVYERRREELRKRYLPTGEPPSRPVRTSGVDHLALVWAALDAAIRFSTEPYGRGTSSRFLTAPRRSQGVRCAESAVCIMLLSKLTPGGSARSSQPCTSGRSRTPGTVRRSLVRRMSATRMI